MSIPSRHSLPARPSLEYLRKQAKKRVRENPQLTLASAQYHLAKEYGFTNWTELMKTVKAMSAESTAVELLEAAIMRHDLGDAGKLLDQRPELLTPVLWPVAIFRAKSLEVTRLLLERGLNPDECSAPRKPLHLAVYQCLPDIVELLIANHANVKLRNSLGETPLDLLDAYEPRSVGDPDVARIRCALLKAGADEDIDSLIRVGDVERLRNRLFIQPELARADSEWGGPLFVAARSARVEAVRLLMEFGADPNKINAKGNTPLWFAAQSAAESSARIEVMQELWQAGAEINRRCENGSTALAMAAWRGPIEVVKFLLKHGALSGLKDDAGKLPRDYAESGSAMDKEETMRLLAV